MKRGINKVFILGVLEKTPDHAVTPSGVYVTRIVVETSESWKDKESGQVTVHTQHHRIVFFNEIAIRANNELKKGSQIRIEGKIRTRSYTIKGSDTLRYITEIIAEELLILRSDPVSPVTESKNEIIEQPDSECPF